MKMLMITAAALALTAGMTGATTQKMIRGCLHQ